MGGQTFDPTKQYTTDSVGVPALPGQRITDSAGAEWEFGKASEALTSKSFCQFDKDNNAEMCDLTSTAAKRGLRVGVPQIAVTSGYHAWFLVKGATTYTGLGLANCAANVKLNSTATPGYLDDDATAGSEEIIGAVFSAAVGGANAAQTVILNHPYIGATL